jgi:hypothetical protein
MSEWQKFSRLPAAPEYWTDLEQRINRATARMVVPGRRRGRWLDAVLLGGIAASAAAVVVLMAPAGSQTARGALQASLAPSDPVARELLSSATAPHISQLLSAYSVQSNR